MKIYMMTDLEGISGIYTPKQTNKNSPEYEKYARKLLTYEVNAAVEGALASGATEILVVDGHVGGGNFILEELHPEAQYISLEGATQILPGLDKSFNGCFFIGCHAMAGTKGGVLDHTQSSASWYNYYVNGKKIGEIGLWALVAGHFRIPVLLVTGDVAAVKEAEELLEKIETVAVKEGYTRHCAKLIQPAKARELVKEGARKALSRIEKIKPLIFHPPLEIKLELYRQDMADEHERKLGVRRIDARTVAMTVDSALDILKI